MKKILDWKLFLVIQAIASVLLTGLIIKTGLLPIKFLLIVVVVLALLLAVNARLMLPTGKHSTHAVRSNIFKGISLVLSILLFVASFKVFEGDLTLSKITGADTQTFKYNVIVLKSSSYKTLTDLENKDLQYYNSPDDKYYEKVISNVKDVESSIQVSKVNGYKTLVNNLYNKKTDAIVMNEASYALVEDAHPNFENEIRVIYTKEYTEKIKSITKGVDVTSNSFNVLISGIDTYGSIATVSRSDVNMIASVNPKTHQVLLTSIPRDMWVTLPNKGKKDKLTHSGLGGINNTIKAIEGFLDIDINYYVRINFTSLIKMVDAVDGVEVYVEKSFQSNTGPYFNKGLQTLNGKLALSYARERYAFADGDSARDRHQQQIIQALVNKITSPTLITNSSKILASVSDTFQTNMSSSDISSLINEQISSGAKWTFEQNVMKGKGVLQYGGAYMPNNKLYYYIPIQSNVDDTKNKIENVLNGD